MSDFRNLHIAALAGGLTNEWLNIFWFFYVIVEAVRNFLVHTPFKFMLFALLVIGGLLYFFVFWAEVILNEIWRYHSLFNKVRRFTIKKVLSLHLHFWIYDIIERSFDALIRRSMKMIFFTANYIIQLFLPVCLECRSKNFISNQRSRSNAASTNFLSYCNLAL